MATSHHRQMYAQILAQANHILVNSFLCIKTDLRHIHNGITDITSVHNEHKHRDCKKLRETFTIFLTMKLLACFYNISVSKLLHFVTETNKIDTFH